MVRDLTDLMQATARNVTFCMLKGRYERLLASVFSIPPLNNDIHQPGAMIINYESVKVKWNKQPTASEQ